MVLFLSCHCIINLGWLAGVGKKVDIFRFFGFKERVGNKRAIKNSSFPVGNEAVGLIFDFTDDVTDECQRKRTGSLMHFLISLRG